METDVLGLACHDFSEEQRKLVAAHPRGENFKEGIINAFAGGLLHKPLSTFGAANADVLALNDPGYKRLNCCSIIRGSAGNQQGQDVVRRAAGCSNPLHQY